MCEDYTRLSTRIATISLQKSLYPNFIEALILLLEYIQLMTLALAFNPSILNAPDDEQTFFRGIIYIARMFNPGHYITFENRGALPFTALFIILGFMIFRYLLCAYIIGMAHWNFQGWNCLKSLWGLVFKLQGRIICALVGSFWVNAVVSAQQDGFNYLGLGKTGIIVLSVFMLVLEYSFSFALTSRLTYMLPTKSFLSAKGSQVENLVLFQKLAIQIMQMALATEDPDSGVWVFVCINLILSLARDGQFYNTLPLYNLRALKLESCLLMIVTALNIASFFQAVVDAAGDSEPKAGFVIVVWAILSILAVKMSYEALTNTLLDITASKMVRGSPEVAVHKVLVMKKVRKLWNGLNDANEKNEWYILLSKSLNSNAKKTLSINPEFPSDIALDINSKQSARRMFLHYLENLISKYPKNSFLKLYLAYFSARKLKQYGNAIKLVNEIQQTASYRVGLSASILIFEIQNLIKKQYDANEDDMNIFSFTKSQSDMADIKDIMLKQADIQIKLYHGILEEIPDLSKVFNLAQDVTAFQTKMAKKINTFLNTVPDSFLDPVLLCGQYYLLLNHSMTDYNNFTKLYSKKYEKYAKFFKYDKLTPENFYQDTNAFFILSGQKADSGKIVYCSRSTEGLLGGDPRLYLGTNISVIMPPSLQTHYGLLFRSTTEGTEKSIFNKVTRHYVFHKDGYMVEVESFLSLHPFLAHGFYYTLVIRPVPTTRDLLLVHENGDIECGTKKISAKLGLANSTLNSNVERINIRTVSEELGKANEAFNIMAYIEEEEHRNAALLSEHNTGVSSEGTGRRKDKPFARSKKTSAKRTDVSRHTNTGPPASEMMLETAQEIYKNYTSESGVEIFAQAVRRREGKGGYQTSQTKFSYTCLVSNIAFGDLHMKLFNLEENSRQENFFELADMEAENGTTTLKVEIDTATDQDQMIRMSDFREDQISERIDNSGFFKSEDEKEKGWIDLNLLRSEIQTTTQIYTQMDPYSNYRQTTNPDYLLTQTQGEGGNLLSPLRSPLASPLASPTGPLIKRNETTKSKQTTIIPLNVASKTTASANDKNKFNGVKTTEKNVIIPAGSITGSQWSKTSQQRKISSAYKKALAIKYYPKSFTPICLAFYAILAVIFATQVSLKVTIDNNVEELETKKEILSHAQLSNYYLVQVEAAFRLIESIESGRLLPAELGLFGYLGTALVGFCSTILASLSVSNADLVQNTDSLSDANRNVLFEADVKIYDNYFDDSDQTYTSLSNFEGTNRIIESGLEAIALQSTSITESLAKFPFIYRNSLNDLLVKNEDISDIFSASLESQRQRITDVVTQYLIITLTVLTVLLVAFCVVIWKQYSLEKSYMHAIIKLNNKRIQDLLNCIQAFIKVIETEKPYDQVYNESFTLNKIKSKDGTTLNKFGANREHNKTPTYMGMTLKYFIYNATLFAFIMILAGLVIWNTLQNKTSLSFFESTQAQVYFFDHLRSRSYLAQVTSIELLNTQGLATVENVPVEEKLQLCIEEVSTMRIKASTIFLTDSSTDTDAVKEFLFDDGCSSEYVTANAGPYCSLVAAQGTRTGLIYMLSTLEDSLTSRLTQFQNSDGSSAAARDIEASDYQFLTALILTISYQCAYASELINASFELSLNDAQHSRTVVLIIFSIGLAILCILMWYFVLVKIKEASNRFKNVLRTLPANLVLSSFILKSFLIKSSAGALDFVKNEL